MVRYNNETALTPDVFRRIAADLRDFADEYERLAESLEQEEIAAIDVVNYSSLKTAFERLDGHQAKSYTAFHRTRRRMVFDDKPNASKSIDYTTAAEAGSSGHIPLDGVPPKKKRPPKQKPPSP